MSEYDVTVIIAEELAAGNLQRVFAALDPGRRPRVEFIVCSSSPVAALPGVPELDNVRVLQAAGNARIPVLWRDGIKAASAAYVALTTAHCVPAVDWLDRLLSYDLAGELVAVGGAIENRQGDCAHGRAIHMLRYVRYPKARPATLTSDLAADNAIYRKAAIMAYPELLELGFWEPSFHERFVAGGLVMRYDPELVVIHHNQYGVRQFMAQRYEHGIEFGAARAEAMSTARRCLMLCLSPLIPFVFGRKILTQAHSYGLRIGSATEAGWLVVFLLAWSVGETLGYLRPKNQKRH